MTKKTITTEVIKRILLAHFENETEMIETYCAEIEHQFLTEYQDMTETDLTYDFKLYIDNSRA